MTPSEIHLVALPPVALDVARQAAQLAFPGCPIVLIDALRDATSVVGIDGTRLVVLTDANAIEVANATQLADSTDIPRWAVVVLGTDSSDIAETVPPDEWHPHLLARVFRSAVLQQELLCENLRLRGDVKTVARRISHDLRTSVGCIHTNADILGEASVEDIAFPAEIIKQSSLEISQLIDRVSFVLKASADPIPPERLDMSTLLSGALERLGPEINRQHAHVGQPATWPPVNGVPRWTAVVWDNLLDNAVRHSGPSPQIEISWRRDGNQLWFVVSDHGSGVDPAREDTLFSAFDQLHHRRGTGLGLSIVHRLVSLQHGHCAYERSPTGGASFSFSLPADDSRLVS
ncbi:MAG TPA: HAMP domain-containing sensor histidine kinase [Candidatus Didemnitutus sp.]|nr:HAMP domain-containing sensor histidine kinase [Candidatus Didemnitutus sp.]